MADLYKFETLRRGACGWCIKLRICRWWPNEEAQATHTGLVGSFLSVWAPTLQKWKPQGHFDWRCGFTVPMQRKESHNIYCLRIPEGQGHSELGEGQFCLGAGQQASIAYKTVRAKVTNFFQAQLLSGYSKRSPSKSKTGTWGRNPKLGSLSKCPDSGCEQSCHTIKCLGSS